MITRFFRINAVEAASQFIDQKERVMLFFYGMFMGLGLSWAVTMYGYSTTPLPEVLFVLAVIDLLFACWGSLACLLTVAAFPDLAEGVKRSVILWCMLGAVLLVATVVLGIVVYARA